MHRLPHVAHIPPEPSAVLIEHMLGAAGRLAPLPRWLSKYPLSLTTATARQTLWALGRRLTQRPDVGFDVAERVPADAIGSLWELYCVAPSLRALTEAYPAWSSLLLDFMTLQCVDDGPRVWVRLTAPPHIAVDRAEQDFRAAMFVKTWRALQHAPSLAAAAVDFSYAHPSSTRRHEQALGTKHLKFSQPHFQISLSVSLFHKLLPGANSHTFDTLHRAACAAAQAATGPALGMRVDAAIAEGLADSAHAPAVARALGYSVRSLRRLLSAEGLTFRELRARVQRREAELLLEAKTHKARDLAALLGFANDGALRNALRRFHAQVSTADS